MINKGLFTSNTNEWSTPQSLFDELNQEFHFELDPCSTHQNAKCERHFTMAEDGLKQPWGGGATTFCNPPYGRAISKWVAKCYKEHLKGSVVVMLIPARTDTSYFHDYIYSKGFEIRFLRGRVRFVDENGNGSKPAPFPSMIVVMR